MSKKTTYNLTIWQKLGLPLLWLHWATLKPELRKSWHEVKKGIEKHKHRYTKLVYDEDIMEYLYQCEHEGCTCCDFEYNTND